MFYIFFFVTHIWELIMYISRNFRVLFCKKGVYIIYTSINIQSKKLPNNLENLILYLYNNNLGRNTENFKYLGMKYLIFYTY